MGQRTYTPDAELQFRDSYAQTASAAAQVGGADKIIDVGAARFEAVMLIDLLTGDIVSNDEEYQVILQGSSSATFASDIQNLARIDFGATEARDGGAIDTSVGRYEMPFLNEADGIIYRYLRLYTLIAGTTPSLNYTAWAGEKY